MSQKILNTKIEEMTDSQFGDKNLDLDGGWVNEQARRPSE